MHPDNSHPTSTASAAGRTAGKSVAWSFTGSVLAIATGLVWAVAIPRLLGPDDYGSLAVVNSLIEIAATVSGLGAAAVFARFHPTILAGSGRAAFAQAASLYIVVIAGLGTVLGAVVWLSLRSMGTLGPGYLVAVAGGVGAVLLAIFYGSNARLYGENRLREYSLWAPGKLMAAVVLVPLLHRWRGVAGAVYGLVAANGLGVLAMTIVSRPLTAHCFTRSSLRWLREFLPFGVLAMSASLTITATVRGGNIALAAIGTPSDQVAFFALGVNIVFQAQFLASSLGQGLVPTLSHLIERGDQQRAQEWIARCAKYQVVMGLLFVATVLLVGEPALDLVLGDKYQGLWPIAVALSPGAIIIANRTLSMRMAAPLRCPRVSVESLVASVVPFVLGTLLLGPHMGIWGAVIAFLGGAAIGATVAAVRIRTLSGMTVVDRKTALTLGVGAALLGIVAWSMPDCAWLRLVVLAVYTLGLLGALGALRLLMASEIRQMVQMVRGKSSA